MEHENAFTEWEAGKMEIINGEVTDIYLRNIENGMALGKIPLEWKLPSYSF